MSFSAAFIDAMRDTVRDRAAIVTMIVAVLIYGFYYPEAYSHQVVDRLPLVVIDLDDSVSSRELLRRVDSLRGVEVAAMLDDLPEAEKWITSRRADAILLILPRFERDILSGGRGRGRVAVYGNGANLLRAGTTGLRTGAATTLQHAGRALLGTGAFFALVGVFSSAHFAGFVPWFHDYPRGGNPTVLALAIPVFALAVTSLGLFIGSFFRMRERAMLFLLPAALPTYFLSGVSWQVETMPAAVRGLAVLLPSTHGIPLIMKLNQMGARLEEVATEFAALVLLTALYGALAWWRYRPRALAEQARQDLSAAGNAAMD